MSPDVPAICAGLGLCTFANSDVILASKVAASATPKRRRSNDFMPAQGLLPETHDSRCFLPRITSGVRLASFVTPDLSSQCPTFVAGRRQGAGDAKPYENRDGHPNPDVSHMTGLQRSHTPFLRTVSMPQLASLARHCETLFECDRKIIAGFAGFRDLMNKDDEL